jgi:hypothetical protein
MDVATAESCGRIHPLLGACAKAGYGAGAQHDLHPIWLRMPAVIDQKLEYIHMNPVKEGLVAEAHHYVYSSASAYAGLPSVLAVEMI